MLRPAGRKEAASWFSIEKPKACGDLKSSLILAWGLNGPRGCCTVEEDMSHRHHRWRSWSMDTCQYLTAHALFLQYGYQDSFPTCSALHPHIRMPSSSHLLSVSNPQSPIPTFKPPTPASSPTLTQSDPPQTRLAPEASHPALYPNASSQCSHYAAEHSSRKPAGT